MGSRPAFLVAGVLVLALTVSSCAPWRSGGIKTAVDAPASTLTPEQQKIVDYVLAHWGKEMNVTGVSLAMRVVGAQSTADNRYAIGMHLKNHPELHRTLRRFGWETVALSPQEKRIALVLSRAERERKPVPSLNELGQLLRETPDTIASSLSMLERFGIVRRDRSAAGVGYRWLMSGMSTGKARCGSPSWTIGSRWKGSIPSTCIEPSTSSRWSTRTRRRGRERRSRSRMPRSTAVGRSTSRSRTAGSPSSIHPPRASFLEAGEGSTTSSVQKRKYGNG